MKWHQENMLDRATDERAGKIVEIHQNARRRRDTEEVPGTTLQEDSICATLFRQASELPVEANLLSISSKEYHNEMVSHS
jgi:hypothetical protein